LLHGDFPSTKLPRASFGKQFFQKSPCKLAMFF
jgi:hypothetical protein